MPTFQQFQNFATNNNPFEQKPIIAYRHSFLNAENEHQEISVFNDHLFNDDGELRQSRNDVFNRVNNGAIQEAILSILYWGFNRNQRGIGTRLYESFNNVIVLARYIQQHQNITAESFLQTIVPMMNNCHGLGLAFFSKLFYFFNLHINGFPCIILDSRVRETVHAINDPRLNNLRHYSAYSYSRYPQYIEEISRIAQEFGCQPDQIEYALFMHCNCIR